MWLMKKYSASNQYHAAFLVSLISAGYGMHVTWTNRSFAIFTSHDSPLPTGRIEAEEILQTTLFKSYSFIFWSIFFGFTASKCGRKNTLCFMSIPTIVAWLLIWFAQNVYYIYAARLIQGFVAAGLFTISQLYFIEICNDDNRGTLGTTLSLGEHAGILIGFMVDAYYGLEVIPLGAIICSVLFGVLFYSFPETPLFLVKQNKLSEAAKSVQFYKNFDENSVDPKIIQVEIEKLQQLVGDEKFKWSYIVRRPFRKSIMIGIFLAVLDHMSGSFCLIGISAIVDSDSESYMTYRESAFMIGVIQMVGTSIAYCFVDRIGRKPLYIISLIGSMFGFIALGLYMLYPRSHYDSQLLQNGWISIASIGFIILAQSVAISSLAFTFTAEVFPVSLREAGISLCNGSLGVSGLVFQEYFAFMNQWFGFYGSLLFLGIVCIPNTIFIVFVLPETKGKTHQEIMKSIQ